MMTPRSPRTRVFLLQVLFVCLGLVLKGPVLLAMPQIQRTVLPNQLVLLVAEEHALPMVTFQLLIEAGSRRDPPGREGLANLTAQALLRGTSGYSVNEFSEALDFIGASLHVTAGRDFVTYQLRVLKKDIGEGFDLLTGALTEPTFPEKEIQKQVGETLAAIQSAEEEPGEVAQKAFQKALFPNSPYGHPVEGTEQSLLQITRRDVARFYETFFHPNNAILAIVGDITLEEVRATLLPRLAQWAMAPIPAEPGLPSFAEGPQTVKIDRPITQAHIVFGHEGIRRENPDYYALTVMNYILGGGGFGSRLFQEIRVKRGLAYHVGSHFFPGKYTGSFQIVVQTKNASALEVISLLQREMRRIQREPVSEEELNKAKGFLVGNLPLRVDTQAKLAGFATQLEYYGLGLDYPDKYPSYIDGVTREDVLRVARSYLHPDRALLVVVGDLEKAGM